MTDSGTAAVAASTPPIGALMIVDDNTIDQMLCRRLIERSGLVGKVITVLSAEDALEHLRTAELPVADAILLDINMPGMDGFEFLDAAIAEMGDQLTSVVVLMLTTSLDPKDRERASRYSIIREFYNKPLVIEHLERIVELLDG